MQGLTSEYQLSIPGNSLKCDFQIAATPTAVLISPPVLSITPSPLPTYLPFVYQQVQLQMAEETTAEDLLPTQILNWQQEILLTNADWQQTESNLPAVLLPLSQTAPDGRIYFLVYHDFPNSLHLASTSFLSALPVAEFTSNSDQINELLAIQEKEDTITLLLTLKQQQPQLVQLFLNCRDKNEQILYSIPLEQTSIFLWPGKIRRFFLAQPQQEFIFQIQNFSCPGQLEVWSRNVWGMASSHSLPTVVVSVEDLQ